MKINLFIVLCFLSFITSATTNCTSPKSQFEMNYCAGERLEKIEKDLEKKIRNLRNSLILEENQKLLMKSYDAWVKYRDAHCDSVTYIQLEGSIHSYMNAECKSLLTERKLKTLLNDYENTLNVIEKGSP